MINIESNTNFPTTSFFTVKWMKDYCRSVDLNSSKDARQLLKNCKELKFEDKIFIWKEAARTARLNDRKTIMLRDVSGLIRFAKNKQQYEKSDELFCFKSKMLKPDQKKLFKNFINNLYGFSPNRKTFNQICNSVEKIIYNQIRNDKRNKFAQLKEKYLFPWFKLSRDLKYKILSYLDDFETETVYAPALGINDYYRFLLNRIMTLEQQKTANVTREAFFNKKFKGTDMFKRENYWHNPRNRCRLDVKIYGMKNYASYMKLGKIIDIGGYTYIKYIVIMRDNELDIVEIDKLTLEDKKSVKDWSRFYLYFIPDLYKKYIEIK